MKRGFRDTAKLLPAQVNTCGPVRRRACVGMLAEIVSFFLFFLFGKFRLFTKDQVVVVAVLLRVDAWAGA
jgi:hypothetical protein